MTNFESRISSSEKQRLLDESKHNIHVQNPTTRKERIVRNVIIPAIFLLSACLLLYRSISVCNHYVQPARPLEELLYDPELKAETSNVTKVALEAHIMSKCPDARDCLQQLVVPTMERMSDKVDFKLSYIGRYV